jgi:hypothetical protein
VELLSFPHGAFDAGVLDAARAAGYRAAFGIFPECARETLNGFLRGRVAVNPSDWPWEFRLKIMGAYRWQGPRTAMIARQSHDG